MAAMSVVAPDSSEAAGDKTAACINGKAVEKETSDTDEANGARKRRRFKMNGCLPFMEISMEPGTSLREVDSGQFKAEIRRWAKAVVAYARQVSSRFGSSRRSSRFGSSDSSHSQA